MNHTIFLDIDRLLSPVELLHQLGHCPHFDIDRYRADNQYAHCRVDSNSHASAGTMADRRYLQHGLIVVSSSPYGTTEPVLAFHTSDGGTTWTSEVVPVIAGPVYLVRDGKLLTMISGVNQLTLLRYDEE